MKVGIKVVDFGLVVYAYNEKLVKDGKYTKKTKEYYKQFKEISDVEEVVKQLKKEAKLQ